MAETEWNEYIYNKYFEGHVCENYLLEIIGEKVLFVHETKAQVPIPTLTWASLDLQNSLELGPRTLWTPWSRPTINDYYVGFRVRLRVL